MLDYEDYVETYVDVLRRVDRIQLDQLADLLVGAWRNRRTIFLCGNGGNAAAASHLVTDLARLTTTGEGPRLKAIALGDNSPGLSAIANDQTYEDIFVEQLKTFLEPDDVLIGLSTSGSSPNILRAVECGERLGAVTIGITGLSGDALRSRVAFPLVIPSVSTQQLEDATMFVGHLLCLRVRDLIASEIKNGIGHTVRIPVTRHSAGA